MQRKTARRKRAAESLQFNNGIVKRMEMRTANIDVFIRVMVSEIPVRDGDAIFFGSVTFSV